MASSIDAITSGAGGIVTTADNTGILQLKTAGTTAVTVDASQNVGIGTTTPSNALQVTRSSGEAVVGITNSGTGSSWVTFTPGSSGGAYLHNTTASPTVFTTNGTERMRIDSSGNLLVGTTGTFDMGFGAQKLNSRATNQSAGFFAVTDGTNEPIMLMANATSSGYTNRMVDMRTNMPTGTGFTAYSYMSNTNTLRFYVRGDGVIFSTSTAISAISDVRHKENIRELDTGLKEVLALQPRRFDWKENQGTNEKDVPGFIAQEVESVIPELVEDWRNEGEEETYKALKMGNMIPTLVKAIQEQQTIINDLKARIETLENS